MDGLQRVSRDDGSGTEPGCAAVGQARLSFQKKLRGIRLMRFVPDKHDTQTGTRSHSAANPQPIIRRGGGVVYLGIKRPLSWAFSRFGRLFLSSVCVARRCMPMHFVPFGTPRQYPPSATTPPMETGNGHICRLWTRSRGHGLGSQIRTFRLIRDECISFAETAREDRSPLHPAARCLPMLSANVILAIAFNLIDTTSLMSDAKETWCFT